MSLDVKASRNDMVAQLHLDAVTVQDMARPQDSPFRHMMYTMPDENSHGGLIHVTYWESAGGVRRIPPSWIAETGGQRYDQVVDARVSTLQVRRSPPLKVTIGWMIDATLSPLSLAVRAIRIHDSSRFSLKHFFFAFLPKHLNTDESFSCPPERCRRRPSRRPWTRSPSLRRPHFTRPS